MGKVTGRGELGIGRGWRGQRVRGRFGRWEWGKQGSLKGEIGVSGGRWRGQRGGGEIGGVGREMARLRVGE